MNSDPVIQWSQADGDGILLAGIQPTFRQIEVMLWSDLPISADAMVVEINESVAVCFEMQMARDRRGIFFRQVELDSIPREEGVGRGWRGHGNFDGSPIELGNVIGG